MSLRTFTLFDQLSLFGDESPTKPEIVIENIQENTLVNEDDTKSLLTDEPSLFNDLEDEIAISTLEISETVLHEKELEVFSEMDEMKIILENSETNQSQEDENIIGSIVLIDSISENSILLENNSDNNSTNSEVDSIKKARKLNSTVKKEKIKAEPKTKKSKTESINNSDQIISIDWKGDKQYYSIGEVAELFKVNTSHIRFWTNEFKLKVRTTGKGDRLYTNKQILELRTIHHLVKEKGFTLAGAKTKLKEISKKGEQTFNLKQALKDLKTKLIDIREQLN